MVSEAQFGHTMVVEHQLKQNQLTMIVWSSVINVDHLQELRIIIKPVHMIYVLIIKFKHQLVNVKHASIIQFLIALEKIVFRKQKNIDFVQVELLTMMVNVLNVQQVLNQIWQKETACPLQVHFILLLLDQIMKNLRLNQTLVLSLDALVQLFYAWQLQPVLWCTQIWSPKEQ